MDRLAGLLDSEICKAVMKSGLKGSSGFSIFNCLTGSSGDMYSARNSLNTAVDMRLPSDARSRCSFESRWRSVKPPRVVPSVSTAVRSLKWSRMFRETLSSVSRRFSCRRFLVAGPREEAPFSLAASSANNLLPLGAILKNKPSDCAQTATDTKHQMQ